MPDPLLLALQQRKQQGLYRRQRILQSAQGPVLRYEGREYLNFCSNDYLGLANHPKLIAALKSGTEQWGVGAGASHLVCGHHQTHQKLQLALAEFTQRPAALLFSSGYMANLAVISTLMAKGDYLFEDRLNHASLIDGARLSGAHIHRYQHGNCEHLAQQLHKRENSNNTSTKLIVTDGVFSMDGDLAPLPQLAQLATQHHAWLMVDDAHGFGVLGCSGGGLVQHSHLNQQQVPILMATFGKALGCFGAFVAGSEQLIETLIQFARPYIYTTALPPAFAHTVSTALELVREQSWRRTHLQQLIQRYQQGITQLGIANNGEKTPIQPLLLGSADLASAWSQALWDQGIYISAIRPPTVPNGKARLRISLSAAHQASDVDRLLSSIAQIKQKLGALADHADN